MCPRGADSSASTYVRKIALGNNGEVFVGGNFHARVWTGDVFVDVYDLAKFSPVSGWLPLVGNSQLLCLQSPNCPVGVYSLAWDNIEDILYIGGTFDYLDNTPITSGLCQWTIAGGIEKFPGGSVTNSPSAVYSQVVSLQFSANSESLYIAGSFLVAGNINCQNIVVWRRKSGSWMCLYQASVAISVIDTMLFDANRAVLYISGIIYQ